MTDRLRSRASRAWALSAALLTLAGCAADEPVPEPPPPAYTEVTPAADAAPAPEPEPEPEGAPTAPPEPEQEPQPPQQPPPAQQPPQQPPPPEPEPPAGAPRVTFVRVGALAVGGDFDSAGDEEVVVETDLQGAHAVLFEGALDLPDEALEAFTFEESAWTELPEVAELSLDLSVVEADVTENETMCGSNDPVVVRPLAAGATESTIEVRLSTIRGESSGLFQATKRFVIPGPSLELRLLRVARRDAPDAPGRRLVADAFAGLAEAVPPGPGQVDELQSRVGGWARAAQRAGERSTHTWARKTLAALSEEADELAHLLSAGGSADPSDLAEKRAALASALETVGPADQRPALDAVARAAKAPAEPTSASLTALQALVEAAQKALGELDAPPASVEAVSSALDEYSLAVDLALGAALARDEVGPKLKALQGHVATARGD